MIFEHIVQTLIQKLRSSIVISGIKSGLKDPRFLLILMMTKDATSKIKDSLFNFNFNFKFSETFNSVRLLSANATLKNLVAQLNVTSDLPDRCLKALNYTKSE